MSQPSLPFRAPLCGTLVSAALLACAAGAQTSPGPGLGNLTYTGGELYKTLSTFHPVSANSAGDAKGMNAVAMHKGYLFFIYGEDSGRPGGGISFYDVSNPRTPRLVHSRHIDDLRESHGFGFHSRDGKDYVAMQSIHGVHIWDITDVGKPALVKDFRIAGVSASDYDQGAWWVMWQAPYIFVARGQDGFSVVDAADPANPKLLEIMVDGTARQAFPISKTGNFKLGPLFVVGNLLVATNMGTGRNPGYSTIDVSDPRNPRLLDTDNSTSCYATMLNGNRLYCAGVDAVNGMLVVHDLSDPTAIVKVGQSQKAGGRGEYVSVQDGFAHMGVEDRYAKFNLSDLSIVHNSYALADANGCCAQEGFANPLGNLVLVTDDHSVGSSLIPHQTAPDKTPPKVNMVSPANGAANQKVTSRVGVTFTDQIDVQSLNAQTFMLRPVGGEALPGRWSSQTSIVNFTPLEPLKANTTYELVIPAGGVKDYAGNPTGEAYASRFTTGPSLAIPRRDVAENGSGLRALPVPGGYDFVVPGDGRPGSARLELRDMQGTLLGELSFDHDGRETHVRWDGRSVSGHGTVRGLVVAGLRRGGASLSRTLYLP